MSSNHRLVGYVTVREFGGFRMPVPVQNLVLRSYAQNLKMTYALPQCEHKYRGSYMQLFTTLIDALPNDHIGMCSAAMLPPQGEMRRQAFSIIRDKGLTLHLVFDSVVATSEEDFLRLEEGQRIANEVRRADGVSVVKQLRALFSETSPD